MSLPSYLEYKDSGTPWLGKIPGHWQVVALKHVLETPITDGPHETPEFLDEGIPFVSAEAVSSGNIDFRKIRGYISDQDHQRYSSKYKPRLHDIYIIKSGATTGVTAIVECEAEFNIWSPLAAIRCNQNIVDPFFTLNYLRSSNFQEAIALNWSFGTQQNIGMGVLGDLQVVVPPLREQRGIANFLRCETAKIEILIAEQEKLLTLLAEKRQATISHAVTRGLNPDAPMKDSSVAWLGEVPTHWHLCAIKRVGSIRYGIGEPPEYREEGVPLIRATNVHAGKIFRDGLVYVDPMDIPRQRIVWLKNGDIIVVRSGAYTGDSGLVESDYEGSIAGFDMVLRLHSCAPRFAKYVLLSSYLKDFQIDLKKMRAAQPHLNAEELGECVIAFPPEDEQLAIVEFLDREIDKLDCLKDEAERAIDLLKERRSALIAAAVTGKIDVRNAAPEELAA
ncbi:MULTISPECIES: restriction endonuclease subunit S [Burkholderia cepacia complex]|uniref:restriction endonuclease subunit S n=1 Tax=Burkholderia cepacia complex TaxID=87882 RepID=UPI0009BCDFD7|nr:MULTISPECIES: restriction endonuclease subunit S [Burkholderia cepacia complex]